MKLQYLKNVKKWIIYRIADDKAISVGDTIEEALVEALIIIKKNILNFSVLNGN